ncbi:MAG: ribokinase [Spirochaetales bacterium]|nr:ribokinase [Spirochaetales bacterium]
MKILNIGSLNIDDVYQMDHFVKPGETQTSLSYAKYCGGKGLNQSIALARAGGEVSHAGRIGHDGLFLKEKLDAAGVNTRLVSVTDEPSGRAIIQVNRQGENSIILNSGSNRTFTQEDIDSILSGFGEGDILLLQNEINMMNEIILGAASKGLKIALNPAPMDETINSLPLASVSIFILNEIEGEGLTGVDKPEAILDRMAEMFPDADVFLTLGSKGVKYTGKGGRITVEAQKVTPVDTTAAGDTFTGYILTALSEGMDIKSGIELATKAAAITVTREGAADSIPTRDEL